MSTIFTTEDYLQPEWSAMPKHKCFFEVIKEGILLGSLPIKEKSFNLIGRLEDLCDVFIDNQTVSRKHAILQFKKQDQNLYLYDLATTHGTYVNKQKLPTKTYKLIKPYDNLKFGISSRVFVFRCPELQRKLEEEETIKENKFIEILEERKKTLSKTEIKEKYLQMLENDPYASGNMAFSRKLKGKQEASIEDEYEGIDWGISDEREVYAYKNQYQFPIQPDILRRLHLDAIQLNKLAQFQENQRKYQEIEAQLNQLANKEQRQFGLEEKLQNKKQKMQKKFVESLEMLEKSQDWLRTNIFGENIQRDQQKNLKKKQIQNDTFGDDDYLDRTLQNKHSKENFEEKKNQKRSMEPQIMTTDDFWQLQKKLKFNVNQLEELKKSIGEIQKKQDKKNQQNVEDEVDLLEVYMKENNEQLDIQNKKVLQFQIQQIEREIQGIKEKLKEMVGEKQLNLMIDSITNPKEIQSKSTSENHALNQTYLNVLRKEQEKERLKKKENDENLEKILANINRIAEEGEQNDQDELSPSIFKYYQSAKSEEVEDNLEENSRNRKVQDVEFEAQVQNYETPLRKLMKKEEEFIDLTKKYNS